MNLKVRGHLSEWQTGASVSFWWSEITSCGTKLYRSTSNHLVRFLVSGGRGGGAEAIRPQAPVQVLAWPDPALSPEKGAGKLPEHSVASGSGPVVVILL